MELTQDQTWHFLLELRRDLTLLQIQVQMLEEETHPKKKAHGDHTTLAKLRQELDHLNARLADSTEIVHYPSI